MTAEPVQPTEIGADLRHVRSWIFDLDDTLYPPERQILKRVSERIGQFMVRTTGLPLEEARALQKRYLLDHGAALGGLMKDYTIDPEVFLAEVHDVPLDDLQTDEGLRAGLERLKGPRYVFTNGSTRHGERVLEQLGISDLFDGLFAVEHARLVPKPHPDTFALMLARFELDPATAAFFEDTARNLEHAKTLGMTTVLVGPHALDAEAPFVDHRAAALGPFLATAILPGDPT
ncbi:MAG TPA: pyrimidine 5'-nucleotidase [Brevundimonas sp.]|nr:pyrimidine 5'-nucleotidase [Brevundimonas sp.]